METDSSYWGKSIKLKRRHKNDKPRPSEHNKCEKPSAELNMLPTHAGGHGGIKHNTSHVCSLMFVPEPERDNHTAFTRQEAQQFRMCGGRISSRGQCQHSVGASLGHAFRLRNTGWWSQGTERRGSCNIVTFSRLTYH